MKRNMIEMKNFYGKVDFDENLLSNMEIVRELNLSPEICITDSTYLFDRFQPIGNRLHTLLTANALEANFHLPFYGLQLGCKDSYIRELSFELIMKGLQRMAELGITSAVMHV